jgi:hypothetical protein
MSRYAEVRPNTSAIVAASRPGGAIETPTLEVDADAAPPPLNVSIKDRSGDSGSQAKER